MTALAEAPPAKHAGGRPSLYDPAYCDSVISFMGKGYSLTAYAGEIGVCRETLLEWQHVHPEFSIAVKRAKAARTRSLEAGLLSEEIGARVTARIFALKNAAPDEWRDRREVEYSGGLTHEVRSADTIDARLLSPEDREALKQALVDALAQQRLPAAIEGECVEVES